MKSIETSKENLMFRARIQFHIQTIPQSACPRNKKNDQVAADWMRFSFLELVSFELLNGFQVNLRNEIYGEYSHSDKWKKYCR